MPKITGDSIAEHVAAQEAAVIASTVSLFAERGASNVTIAEIAAGVGLARTSVYRYFPTKGAIVARWFETALNPVIEAGDRIAGGDDPPSERLKAWVTAQSTFLAQDGHQAMIVAARELEDMSDDVDTDISDRHRDLYRSLHLILEELNDPAGLADDDAASVVEARVLLIAGLLANFGDMLATGMDPELCRAEIQRAACCIAG